MTEEVKKKNVGGRPKKKHAGGRPSKMTAETLSKLESAFSIGANDREACAHASIGNQTYYTYCKKNPEYLEQVNRLKEKLPLMAKTKLAKFIQDNDKQTVQWYLERKRKSEFSLKTEIDLSSEDGTMTPERDLEAKLKELGIERRR